MEKEIVIDVREKDEFLAEHVPGSINIPLTDFASHGPAVLRQISDRSIVFLCRSGNRARLAVGSLNTLGVRLAQEPKIFQGGIVRWKHEGGDVVKFHTGHMPILRQTHVAAGALVLAGVVLALGVHPAGIWLSAFVGAGLVTAGVTGFCGMGLLLAKMPWNRKKEQKNIQIIQAAQEQ
jgi:rhodanese-related sulfurtransferase